MEKKQQKTSTIYNKFSCLKKVEKEHFQKKSQQPGCMRTCRTSLIYWIMVNTKGKRGGVMVEVMVMGVLFYIVLFLALIAFINNRIRPIRQNKKKIEELETRIAQLEHERKK
ncbi:hypothetical protein SAMN05192534_110102 [Alteribacillus persepolensis]|uniref:Uncharacterized protein n=1 Tax=Alteribacillus persepolensis TaxID=568899 RepID=A0A1G8EWQ5_9BACI|nr:hypothetical protein SAMN05192534_110102 [Alteribacillus persepolensis]